MTLTVLIAVFGLAGILFLVIGMRRLRRRHVLSGLFSSITAIGLFLLAACALLVAAQP